MNRLLDRISATPALWNVLRRVVEDQFRGEKLVIGEELAPHSNGTRRFLDLGCGTGEFAPCFPARRYVGIDPAPAYIRHAARTRDGAFLVGSGEALPLASGAFDAALIIGVLHHLPDETVRLVMDELWRVLHAGAPVLIMEDVPPPDPWNVAGHAMHWLDRGGYIRSDMHYRALFGPGFDVRRTYHMRSGICDYGVYLMRRRATYDTPQRAGDAFG